MELIKSAKITCLLFYCMALSYPRCDILSWTILFGNYNLWPLNIYNWPTQVYFIKPKGRTHKVTNGKAQRALTKITTLGFVLQNLFMPPPFIMGGHIASPLSVRPYVRTSRTYEKWFPDDIFWKRWCIGFIFHTQVYNHKIQVKFDYGQNPPIIIRVMALDLRMKNGFRAISFEYSYWIHISYTGI